MVSVGAAVSSKYTPVATARSEGKFYPKILWVCLSRMPAYPMVYQDFAHIYDDKDGCFKVFSAPKDHIKMNINLAIFPQEISMAHGPNLLEIVKSRNYQQHLCSNLHVKAMGA